ncbi:MAG: carbohydrate ABC transporter permease [Oscillospiraceae bacterium]
MEKLKTHNQWQNWSDRIFSALAMIILLLSALAVMIPFVNVIAKSLSSSSAVVSGKVSFWPVDIDLTSYKFILSEGTFFRSLSISLFVTIAGTLLSMLCTALIAYPLSKPTLKGRKPLLLLYMFTMVFSCGMIPDYLLVKELGMLNSVWSLIVPGLVWTYNMLILKSYFEGIPQSIEESAKIDGAGWGCIFVKIVMPLSKPALATVSLFYAVAYWNDYFKALLYINKPNVKPLQL